MRKLSYLFSLFVLLTAFTCDNEPLEGDFVEEGNNTVDGNANPQDLIGTWKLINMNADITSETNFGGIDLTSEFLVEINESDYTVTFTESNYTTQGDYLVEASTTVNGETTAFTDSYTNVEGLGTYSTDGNTMTVDGSFVEFDFDGVPTEVAEGEQTVQFGISNNGQTLTFQQNEQQTISDLGVNAVTTVVSTSVWERLE